MERIHYAGGIFVTGDTIAAALVDYAERVVATGTSAAIDIPIRSEDGTQGRARFLLGPATFLVLESEPWGRDEIYDQDLVDEIRERTAELCIGRPHGIPTLTAADVYPVRPDLV
jgi:hypothetical protein